MTLIHDPALWVLTSAVACAAGAVCAAAPYRRRAARDKAENAGLEAQLRSAGEALRHAATLAEAREREESHLAQVRLPSVVRALWEDGGQDGARPAGMLHPHFEDSPFGQAHASVLHQVEELIASASQRSEAAARTAVRAVAQSLQNLAQEQLQEVDAILKRHHGSQMLADLMPVDHAAAQLARKTEVVLALVGEWPGVQQDNQPLLEAVRGGVSRIKDYTRVQIAAAPPYYVTSSEAEPLILIVAELLDNAARFSAPVTRVSVRFVDAHNGVTIEIDDAGIGMTPEALERAGHLLAGRDPVRLTELPNAAQLGHLAVGALAARYGIRVTVRESHYGGVSAIVFVPRALLTSPPAEEQPGAAQPTVSYEVLGTAAVPPLPTRARGAADGLVPPGPLPEESPDGAHGYSVAPDGLPVRARKTTSLPHPAAPPASQPPTDGGLSAAAFVAGSLPQNHHTDDEESAL